VSSLEVSVQSRPVFRREAGEMRESLGGGRGCSRGSCSSPEAYSRRRARLRPRRGNLRWVPHPDGRPSPPQSVSARERSVFSNLWKESSSKPARAWGRGETSRVLTSPDEWCSCPARGSCSHLLALMLVCERPLKRYDVPDKPRRRRADRDPRFRSCETRKNVSPGDSGRDEP
jgi:hypothetical protein